MCGRYGRRSDNLSPVPPGYNITPGTYQPVVRLDEEICEREMELIELGLVPYWY
jgi:putative SOS response-associated peptidase YedK